jgi:hypothetical protein
MDDLRSGALRDHPGASRAESALRALSSDGPADASSGSVITVEQDLSKHCQLRVAADR